MTYRLISHETSTVKNDSSSFEASSGHNQPLSPEACYSSTDDYKGELQPQNKYTYRDMLK